MKISGINNVSFGLKIVKNDDYKMIVDFRKEQGESQKEINDSFERISKLYDDNLSLEFCNSKKKFFDLLGVSAIFSNIKIKGLMRASDSNKQYNVDTMSDEDNVTASEELLSNNITTLLKQEQMKIDNIDWS